jgi:prepilin peptidase CpaA
MSGLIEPLSVPFFLICVLSALAAVTDTLWQRIPNYITLPALAAGPVFFLSTQGMNPALLSLAAAGLALLLYGWMFVIGVMGAGDVKLLMALGAWGGVQFTLQVALLGILIGGAMAAGILIFNGGWKDFSLRMQQFFLALFIKELKAQAPEIDHKKKMPFGIALSLAALCTAMGVKLWQ